MRSKMRSKWINKIFEGVVALIFLVGFTSIPAISQVVPVGKTEEQASQLIFWYDAAFNQFDFRVPLIQVTNAGNVGVDIHVQIFASDASVTCREFDFDDFLTPNDTHIYELFEIIKNSDGSFVPINIINTKGFVVITPINNKFDRDAISFQHLFGNSLIFDINQVFEYGLNAQGRDAVNLTTGNVAPDGTVLNGVASGYVLIQPDVLKFNFAGITGPDPIPNFADIVSIAFLDNYDGPFGGYAAEPADATLTPFIFDTDENQVSCDDVAQDCFFDYGLNEDIGAANPLVNGGAVLCPGTFGIEGWVKMAVTLGSEDTNELGLAGFQIFQFGGADWMHVE